MKRKGVIYILTNPAFPQYVKIGYAYDIENRLRLLTEARQSRTRFGSMRFTMSTAN